MVLDSVCRVCDTHYMDSGLTTITVILILGILGGVLYLIGAGALDEIDRDSDDFDLYDEYRSWGGKG